MLCFLIRVCHWVISVLNYYIVEFYYLLTMERQIKAVELDRSLAVSVGDAFVYFADTLIRKILHQTAVKYLILC